RQMERARSSRTIEGKCRQLGCRPGLGATPPQGIREVTLAVQADDGTVLRVLTLVLEWLGPPFDFDPLALNVNVNESTSILHLMRSRGIEAFHEHVLDVHTRSRHRPRHVLVVTNHDTRQPRCGRACNIPSGSLEMHQVP